MSIHCGPEYVKEGSMVQVETAGHGRKGRYGKAERTKENFTRLVGMSGYVRFWK